MIDWRDAHDLARLRANAFLWLWLALGVASGLALWWEMIGAWDRGVWR